MNFEDAWYVGYVYRAYMTNDLRNVNLPTIQKSCEKEGWGQNNDETETRAIRDSIVEESKKSGIPEELILAVIMQESKGCVRVITTRWSHDNPGLMQSAGQATCNPFGANKPTTPCPVNTIHQMVHDGTAGEGLATTLRNSLDVFEATDDGKWYKTVRRYNAGPYTDAGNLGDAPTPCYASDIANRLINPFEYSTCSNDRIKTLNRAEATYSVAHSDASANIENKDETQMAVPTLTMSTVQPPSVVAPSANKDEPHASEVAPINPIVAGAAAGCRKYYTPQPGDSCQSAPVDLATLRSLNSELNMWCSNLWAGYAYCVAM
jgi:hypothetical protein